ncbi:MAG TPA: hypothetical protein ENF45_01275 [Bacteroidetes bacterium]|nr:hypothetical protein [Bacteroidota bacterium]
MAFTGTLSFTTLGKNTVVGKGASLAADASGTIGNYGDTGADEQLPENFPTLDADLTELIIYQISTANNKPLSYNIAGDPLRITITNTDDTNPTGELRIRVKREHTLVL